MIGPKGDCMLSLLSHFQLGVTLEFSMYSDASIALTTKLCIYKYSGSYRLSRFLEHLLAKEELSYVQIFGFL